MKSKIQSAIATPQSFVFFHSNPRRSCASIMLLISVSPVLSQSALADTKSWSNTAANNLWNNAANWLGGSLPANDLTTDIALFNQTSYTNQPNVGTRQVAGIAIGDGSTATAPLTITTNGGATRLVIGASGIDMKAASGAVTVGVASNHGAMLGASQAWNNDSSSLLTVRSVGNFNTTTADIYTLTISGSGSGGILIDNVIADSATPSTGTTALTINRSGTGAILLSGANTYSAGTTFTAGLLQIGNNSAVGTGTLALNGGTISSNSAAGRTINNALSINGNLTLGDATNSGALIFGANADLGGATRALTTASDVTLSGIVSNGGLTKDGVGSLTLSGENTFSGAMTLSNGTLRIGVGSTALGTGNLVLNGGTIRPSGIAPRIVTNAVTVGGNVILGDAAATGLLTFSANTDLGGTTRTLTTAGNVVLAGSVTNGGIIKEGSGTMTLSGASSYNGGTTVSDGILLINGDNSTATGAVSIASPATLGGDGILGGALTISAGAALAPGATTLPASVGTLTANSGANIVGSYICDIDGANADKLSVTGSVTLSGPLTVNLLAGGFTQPSYIIAEGTALSGTFSSVTPGYLVTYNSTQAILTSTGGTAYNTWIDGYSPNALLPDAASKLPTADPDGDGISNLMEFVLGGSPVVSSQAILPTQAIVGANLVLSYKRSDESESPATTQVGQWSTNLSTWTNVTPALVNENGGAPDDMTVTVPTSNAVAGKLFIRLQVIK